MHKSVSPEIQQQINKRKTVIPIPVDLPSIEGLSVEGDRGRVARSGTTDVDFPSKLHPRDGKDWAGIGTGQGEDVLFLMFQQVKNTCRGREWGDKRFTDKTWWSLTNYDHQNAHPQTAQCAALLEGGHCLLTNSALLNKFLVTIIFKSIQLDCVLCGPAWYQKTFQKIWLDSLLCITVKRCKNIERPPKKPHWKLRCSISVIS